MTSGLCAAALALCLGCGGREFPELAPVAGTVTLDGQPLEGVLVSFYPMGGEGGRPGTDVTDAEGRYELMYFEGEAGARVGPNRVEVTMYWPDGEPSPDIKDKVPRGYGAGSTMTFEVKPGDNKFDIDMKSSGPR
ncbi:MAG: carboxypeptidase regulatory-like domain-containing protein [Planctomycetaceae bacterium]